jgi:urease accessory protein
VESTAVNTGRLEAVASRTDGRLDFSVIADGDRSVVGRLYQQAPLRALFPRPEQGEALTAVLVNSSGGIIGGDRLEVTLEATEGSSLLVTGQAAEKVYRSSGPVAEATTTLIAGPDSLIEFLPQGTIIYDGARFRRVTTIKASPGSRVMAGEVLSLGRVERGERFTTGLLHDEWRVRTDDRLIWADALHLSDADEAGITTALNSAAGFAGSPAYATFLYVAPDVKEQLKLTRQLLGETPESVRAGVTSFDGLLVARWLGANPAEVRGAFGWFWARFRAGAIGKAERLPTIWNI